MMVFDWYLGGLTELMSRISTCEITGNMVDPIISQSHGCKALLAMTRVIAVQTSYLLIMPPAVYRKSTIRFSGGSSGTKETSLVDLSASSINLGGINDLA